MSEGKETVNPTPASTPAQAPNPPAKESKYRDKVYDEKCQIKDAVSGTVYEEMGWFYIVTKKVNVRLLPVDLEAYNKTRTEILEADPVDENFTLYPVPLDYIANVTKTGMQKGVATPNALSSVLNKLRSPGTHSIFEKLRQKQGGSTVHSESNPAPAAAETSDEEMA